MEKDLYLRKAAMEDMWLIYEWANDCDVRSASFQSRQITKEEHCIWYESKMNSETTLFYIMMHSDCPVGQIRLELSGDAAQINYSVEKSYRGQGFGRKMIELAETELCKQCPQIRKMKAEVKPDNLMSAKVFENNQYVKAYAVYEKVL